MIDIEHLNELSELIGKETVNQIHLDYVVDSKSKIEELLNAWKIKNYASLGEVSHSLKSASANMGMHQFSEQCLIIEKAALKKNDANIEAAINDLKQLHQESLQALQHYFSK